MIKDIPKLIRPREKAYRLGVENLSDIELLAIIIQSGTKNKSALQIAEDLLNKYTSIYNILECPFDRLMKQEGISKVKAIQIKTIKELFNRFLNVKMLTNNISFNNSIDVYKYVFFKINNSFQERVIVLFLSSKNKLIYEEVSSIGDEQSAIINNKLICKIAIEKYAKKVIICHNHPSLKCEPSIEDISSYINLKEALILFNIELLDSLIISINQFFSIKNEKLYNIGLTNI